MPDRPSTSVGSIVECLEKATGCLPVPQFPLREAFDSGAYFIEL
jgi:hypothetical protein